MVTTFISSLPVCLGSNRHPSLICSQFVTGRNMSANNSLSGDSKGSMPVATIAAPAPPSAPSPNHQHASDKTHNKDEGGSDGEQLFQFGVVHDIRTPEEFDRLQEECNRRDALLVADFMAKWCRKCKYLLPRFRKMAANHSHVYFCTIDVNAVARLPRQFSIAKMPTFIFIKQDETIETLVGGAAPETVAGQLQAIVERLA